MKSYTSITVIYNPNSTGSSKKLATKFADRLEDTAYVNLIQILPTERVGHAEELAYRQAKSSPLPLIISSSGDGGYHEVINGVMAAKAEGASPVTGLLPAGNANDHYRNLHQKPIEQMIVAGERHFVDLLSVTVKSPTERWQRYAHSYVGVGLTPQVGFKLNQVNLNWLNEKWIALKTLLKLEPVRLVLNGQTLLYDSLIVSNVPHMSKVIGLSKEAKMNDGQFEITGFIHKSKLQLLKKIFEATTKGLEGTQHASQFSFDAADPILMQLDGEVKTLPPHSRVTIKLLPKALECVT